MPNNYFHKMAKEQSSKLSRLVHNAFTTAVSGVEEIKPIFSAAAKSMTIITAKLATKKSEQGLPWAPAGMSNGGENLLLKIRRALWRNKAESSQKLKLS